MATYGASASNTTHSVRVRIRAGTAVAIFQPMTTPITSGIPMIAASHQSIDIRDAAEPTVAITMDCTCAAASDSRIGTPVAINNVTVYLGPPTLTIPLATSTVRPMTATAPVERSRLCATGR